MSYHAPSKPTKKPARPWWVTALIFAIALHLVVFATIYFSQSSSSNTAANHTTKPAEPVVQPIVQPENVPLMTLDDSAERAENSDETADAEGNNASGENDDGDTASDKADDKTDKDAQSVIVLQRETAPASTNASANPNISQRPAVNTPPAPSNHAPAPVYAPAPAPISAEQAAALAAESEAIAIDEALSEQIQQVRRLNDHKLKDELKSRADTEKAPADTPTPPTLTRPDNSAPRSNPLSVNPAEPADSANHDE
ncbi:hypothetical protein [Moraxella caviae]|nr:hypothetical protein [Moraxella caviae]